MTDPAEAESPVQEPWEPEEWLAGVGELHLAEVRMMRDTLDDRINDTRSRSLSLLGMIGTALTIAAALGSELYHPASLFRANSLSARCRPHCLTYPAHCGAQLAIGRES